MSGLIVQIGFCTADVAQTVRRYCEGFGFADAGGRIGWGARQARIQGLGRDTTNLVWWVIGRQRFMNLEFFLHSVPRQRPLPSDWLPDELGWVRWGFATSDFDRAAAYLEREGLEKSPIVSVGELRRICFRDPDVGVFVEVMEDGPLLPGWVNPGSTEHVPRVVYATLSVADLRLARTFYVDAMGLTLVDETLHTPALEALWGLEGAKREALLLDGGRGMFIEVVAYNSRRDRHRADRRLSDQGIMNVALGWYERTAAQRAVDRAAAAGATLLAPLATTPAAATYVEDPLGNSLELLFAPEPLHTRFGWQVLEDDF